MNISKYQEKAKSTLYVISSKEKTLKGIILLGLCGEIGSLAEIYKKYKRGSLHKNKYSKCLKEELGDILWYTVSLASLNNIVLNDSSISEEDKEILKDNRLENELEIVYELFKISSEILEKGIDFKKRSFLEKNIWKILKIIFYVINKNNLSKKELFENNIKKNMLLWVNPDKIYFRDKDYSLHEQLPRKAQIEFIKISDKKIIMRMNNRNLGDHLDDNSSIEDFYRFHDIFHWSYVAFLGWSPVLRALLKAKRKSKFTIDHEQDGARAVILEESISLQIFKYAQKNNFFEGINFVEFNLLKSIRNLTQGLEVENVTHLEWEHTIKAGFKVFRKMKKTYEKCRKLSSPQTIGTLHVDADKKKITFKPKIFS